MNTTCYLAMGIMVSPDEAQAIIEKIPQRLDGMCYIDDLSIHTNRSFNDHLSMVSKVLHRLTNNSLKTSHLKCDRGVICAAFLG